MLYTIVGSIKSGALMSHEYPRAMRGVDWTSKAGLDNPDNNYFFALLDDEAATGCMESAAIPLSSFSSSLLVSRGG